MDLGWLVQSAVTVIALAGLGAFWKVKFDSFDGRLDKFEAKIDYMRDAAAETKEQTAVRMAKFDEHSRFMDQIRQDVKANEKTGWDLDKKVSKIFSMLDQISLKSNIHRDK